jgi:hypothetical protein
MMRITLLTVSTYFANVEHNSIRWSSSCFCVCVCVYIFRFVFLKLTIITYHVQNSRIKVSDFCLCKYIYPRICPLFRIHPLTKTKQYCPVIVRIIIWPTTNRLHIYIHPLTQYTRMLGFNVKHHKHNGCS